MTRKPCSRGRRPARHRLRSLSHSRRLFVAAGMQAQATGKRVNPAHASFGGLIMVVIPMLCVPTCRPSSQLHVEPYDEESIPMWEECSSICCTNGMPCERIGQPYKKVVPLIRCLSGAGAMEGLPMGT